MGVIRHPRDALYRTLYSRGDRVIMLQQMQFRPFAAVKAAMNGSAGTLLAADQDTSATSQPVAVGAQRWGRRFFPTSASTAQTTHEGPSYA